MKKLFLLIAISASVLLSGCKEKSEDNPGPKKFGVNTREMVFEATPSPETAKKLVVVHQNVKWQIITNTDWIDAERIPAESTSDYTSLWISVRANSINEAREGAIIIIGSGEDPISITVRQKPYYITFFDVKPREVELGAGDSDGKFTVQGKGYEWDLDYETPEDTWLSWDFGFNPDDKSDKTIVLLHADENDTGAPRTTRLKVVYMEDSEKTIYVTVTQLGG